MTDPLQEERDNGRRAAIFLLDEAARTRSVELMVEAVREAGRLGAPDTLANYEMITAICTFAVQGWQDSNDRATDSE